MNIPKKLYKKGAGAGFKFYENWAELFFVVCLVIGFIIAVITTSAVVTYTIAFLLGLGLGRYIEIRKYRLGYYLIVLGFLVGYVIGSRYGSLKVVILLFVLGTVISYYAHERKVLQ